MLAGVSLFPLMNAIAKSLTADYPAWQITWARFTGHLLVIAIVFMPRRGLGLARSAYPRRQFMRSMVFFGSNACFIMALPHIELATASAIIFTAPILVTVLSVIFLRERIGIWRWSAVVIGFLGALIVVQPGQGELTVGVWLVLGAATCYAIYQLMTRSLASVDAPDTQIFYTAFAGCIVTSLTVGFVGMVPNNWFDIGKFIALGSLGALGHFLVIQALRRASASFMSPLGYVELLGAAALGYAVFGEVPGVDLWIGAACIVASGLIIAYRQAVVATRRSQAE